LLRPSTPIQGSALLPVMASLSALSTQRLPPQTPGNVAEIRQLVSLHRRGQLSDLEEQFNKMAKVAERSMAQVQTLKDHNEELQEAATRKISRGNRVGGTLPIVEASVYGAEELAKREAWLMEEFEKDTIKAFIRFSPLIFN
jgi:hypothetical protein